MRNKITGIRLYVQKYSWDFIDYLDAKISHKSCRKDKKLSKSIRQELKQNLHKNLLLLQKKEY